MASGAVGVGVGVGSEVAVGWAMGGVAVGAATEAVAVGVGCTGATVGVAVGEGAVVGVGEAEQARASAASESNGTLTKGRRDDDRCTTGPPPRPDTAWGTRDGPRRSIEGTIVSPIGERGSEAARSKNTYLAGQFHRLAARRGKKKALVAVGHSMRIIAYHVLTQKTLYRDLGPNYSDDRDRLRVQHHLTNRLERWEYRVTLDPLTTAA